MSRADLHVHTTASDGAASAREVLAHAARAGFRVLAITDHDTIDGALEAQQLAPQFGLEVIVGEEVSTNEGHLLVLFVDQWLPPNRPVAETIAAAHAQGGLCVAPHPYDWLVPSLGQHGLHERCTGPRRGEWPLDAIEGFNASVIWPRQSGNYAAQAVGRALGVPLVGGSDSHTRETIGLGYTLFPGSTASDLYKAVLSGAVEFSGQKWSVVQQLGFYWATVRQRSLGEALRMARTNMAILN